MQNSCSCCSGRLAQPIGKGASEAAAGDVQALAITLRGVTNSALDPSVDVWRSATLPLVRQLAGLESGLALKVLKRGAHPGGGGEVHLTVPIVACLPPVTLTDEGACPSDTSLLAVRAAGPGCWLPGACCKCCKYREDCIGCMSCGHGMRHRAAPSRQPC